MGHQDANLATKPECLEKFPDAGPLDVEASSEGAGTNSQRKELTGWKLASVMISVTIAAFLMVLDMTIIVTAIPRITTHFHSLNDVGWYGSAFSLSSAALQPMAGRLYTYFNSKWLYLAFLLIFELGSLVCALATSSPIFIVGRAIAGVGSSGIRNGSITIIVASVPLEKRPSLMGILMGIAQLGAICGPLVGGALTEYTTWRWCFYINLPIGGFCAILLCLITIPDVRVPSDDSFLEIISSKLDLVGFVAFASAAVMILIGLQYGGIDYPWKSATVIGLFCGSGIALAFFLIWEYRAGDGAMIPISVLRQREIWASCLTTFFMFAMTFVSAFYLPIYFQSVKGDSAFASGVDMLPQILTQLVSAVLSGFLVQKLGYYLPFSVSCAVLSTIGNGLMTTLTSQTPVATWAGFQVLLGFGRGWGMQMPFLAIQACAAPGMTSIATAILIFSQTLSGAVSTAVANVIFNGVLREELQSRAPHLSSSKIIKAGASAVRDVTPKEDLPAVLESYAKGVDSTFYLATATAICMFIFAWGIGWKDLRKKKAAN